MKPLKLKKVKISKIGNPHILFGGADAAQGHNVKYPPTTGKDTKQDGDCKPGTNGGSTVVRTTGLAPLGNIDSGVQN